jgi:hypothetical protein
MPNPHLTFLWNLSHRKKRHWIDVLEKILVRIWKLANRKPTKHHVCLDVFGNNVVNINYQ